MKDKACRALVVEDDLGLLGVIKHVLEKSEPRIQVTWVGSVSDAIDQIHLVHQQEGRGFDLILSDLFLENLELGTQLWHYCKVHEPTVPFALISSADPATFLNFVGEKETPPPFLPKPFRPADCKTLVDFLLHGQGDGVECG
jgi:CheY-like chemotaxis protein